MAATAEEKLRVLKHISTLGYHGNEWAEAGLLHAMESVIFDEDKESWTDVELQELVEQAEDY